MSEVLNKTHNIISIDQASIPKHLKKANQIFYLPERDLIVLAGWGTNTALITELIAEYLELTPAEQERALSIPAYIKSSNMFLELWKTLENLYQIRAELAKRREAQA